MRGLTSAPHRNGLLDRLMTGSGDPSRSQEPRFHAITAGLLALIALLMVAPTSSASDCDGTSTGFIPLNDLGAGFYQGFQGGLYPGGTNARPFDHNLAGLAQASQIQALDGNGDPDADNGTIVLLSIGMCNTSQEYTRFMQLAQAYADRNPRTFLLQGAQGGATASRIADPDDGFWTVIDDRLAAAQLTREQVQVIWLKEANASPTQSFPVHADSLHQQYRRIMNILRDKYENARICYFSSRIYAGYASSALNPEPYAYESGFAAKWVIEDQIDGDPALNFDENNGHPVNSPWLSWGPYLWADGLGPDDVPGGIPGRSDGLEWLCSDFSTSDGTHPAEGARQKVGQMLLQFLITDATATPWFVVQPSSTDPPPPSTWVLHAAEPNPFRDRTRVGFVNEMSRPVTVEVLTASGRRLRPLVDATLPQGRFDFEWDGTDLDGRSVGSGVYFIRVRSGDLIIGVEKLALTR